MNKYVSDERFSLLTSSDWTWFLRNTCLQQHELDLVGPKHGCFTVKIGVQVCLRWKTFYLDLQRKFWITLSISLCLLPTESCLLVLPLTVSGQLADDRMLCCRCGRTPESRCWTMRRVPDVAGSQTPGPTGRRRPANRILTLLRWVLLLCVLPFFAAGNVDVSSQFACKAGLIITPNICLLSCLVIMNSFFFCWYYRFCLNPLWVVFSLSLNEE